MLTFEGPFSYNRPAIINDVTINRPFANQAPGKKARAMLDTGSNVCVISPTLFSTLQLTYLSSGPFYTLSGREETAIYGAAIILSEDAGTAVIQPAKTVCSQPTGSYDLIIGRAVLDMGILRLGSGRFSFRIKAGDHEPVHG